MSFIIYTLSYVNFTSSSFVPIYLFVSTSATATDRVHPPLRSGGVCTSTPNSRQATIPHQRPPPPLLILSVDPSSLDVTINPTKTLGCVVHQHVHGHHSVSPSLLPPPSLLMTAFYSSSSCYLPSPLSRKSFHRVISGINADRYELVRRNRMRERGGPSGADRYGEGVHG